MSRQNICPLRRSDRPYKRLPLTTGVLMYIVTSRVSQTLCAVQSRPALRTLTANVGWRIPAKINRSPAATGVMEFWS
jgi:hypothetical protein